MLMASRRIFLFVMGLTTLAGGSLVYTNKRAIDLGPNIALGFFGLILIGAAFIAWRMGR